MTFIYALLDPRTEEVRYIGKANDPWDRLQRGHLKDARLSQKYSYKLHWLRQLLSLGGLTPILVILEECSSEKVVWRRRERDWIAYARSLAWPLTNLTEGGDGGAMIFTSLYRLKISDALRRRPPISEETRAKRSAALKGKVRSAESKANISKAQRKRFEDPEQRRRIANALQGQPGRPHTEDTREKCRQANLGRTFSDETRQKMSVSAKARCKRVKESKCTSG